MSFPQMYNLNRKLDQKSQITAKKEEDSNAEDEVLFEKLDLPIKPFRPSSAKAAEILKQKRSTNPKHPPINLKRNQNKNLVDSAVLTRLKPRRIIMDKERLYEENMALKLKNNNLLQEILKLRTKVAQVERELARKEDNTETSQFSKPAHMINNLKSAVKELKSDISIKDEEIHRLRKNFRSTKLNEMELEVQAYIDECTRLRHHLEEIMKQRSSAPMSQPTEGDKMMQNTFNINSLQQENDELSQALSQASQEISRLKGKLKESEKDKKKNLVKKNELSQLKSENIKLKSKADHYTRELAEKELIFKEELNKAKRNLNEAYAKVNNNEVKIKNLICENEEKSKQIKFLQENKMIAKKVADSSRDLKQKESPEKESMGRFEEKEMKTSVKDVKIFDSLKESSDINEAKSELASSGKNRLQGMDDEKNKFSNEKVIKNSEDEGFKDRKGVEGKGIKKEVEVKKKVEVEKEFKSDSEDYDENFEDFEEVKESPAKKQKKVDLKKQEEVLNEKKINDDKSDEDYSDDVEEYKEPRVEIGKKSSGEEEIKVAKDNKIVKSDENNIRKNIEETKNKEMVKLEDNEEWDEKTNGFSEKDKNLPETPKENLNKKGDKSKDKVAKSNEKKSKINEKQEDNKEKVDKPQEKSKDKPLDKPIGKTNTDQIDPSKKSTKSKKSSKSGNPLFRHLALRLQINRIPRTKLSILFKSLSPDKLILPADLHQIFSSAPLNFSKSESESLISSIQDSSKLTPKQLEEKLTAQLETWKIYSAEEEEEIDETIRQTILKHKDSLIESCSNQDSSSSGTISLKAFKKIIQQLQIKLPEKVLKYMQLLFYSHNMNLEEVPYLNFIKAYTEAPEDDFTDEDKAKVARHYLAIIAQILIQNNRTVFDLFECDETGLISPNGFFAGLQRLGLEEIEEEHVMILLEALQFDQAEEVCVHIEELEEILNHYGVGAEAEEGGEEADGNQRHLKKVSLLDSGNYEISEDSPGRTLRKGSDKGISDTSPFTKHEIDENDEDEYDEDFN